MTFIGPPTRGTVTNFQLPSPSKSELSPSIIVGMFDGGVDPNIPILNPYVTSRDAVMNKTDPSFLQHGTAVAGSILYGNLNGYQQGEDLPVPTVRVESYRVLPLSDPSDIDLYQIIDILEEIVPKRSDIKVFNLSIGPYGPIEDDYISRFTYVLDSLSSNAERLFVVAGGNDGELPNIEDRRIQAPSDSVNGLGIGSYTFDRNGKIIRAPYSCIGEGREGCKVKPDIVAFGGCQNNPFHLIGLNGKTKYFDAGTSYSSPIVAGKAAELIGRCNIIDPLVARALMIHSAVHPNNLHDKYLGYGAISDTVEEMIGCTNNKVSVVYKQRMLPKKYAKLNIPFIAGLDYKGDVDIYWTIAIATKPNPLHTEDYTSNCIEDFFYPNVNDYRFSSSDKKQNFKRNLIKDKTEIESLTNNKWTKSTHPLTASGNKYQTEEERRANFKWDTIVKKGVSIKYKNLQAPYLVLHAMDRNVARDTDFFNYAIITTVHYKDYRGNAYQQTLENYNKLEVLSVKTRNQLFVR